MSDATTGSGKICRMRNHIAGACVVILSWPVATQSQGFDPPTRIEMYHAQYEVNADGTHTESHKWSTVVLKEQAIPAVKQAGMSFSTSIQKGEIVEAYTRKKDGRRLNVPKDNYQVSTNQGK